MPTVRMALRSSNPVEEQLRFILRFPVVTYHTVANVIRSSIFFLLQQGARRWWELELTPMLLASTDRRLTPNHYPVTARPPTALLSNPPVYSGFAACATPDLLRSSPPLQRDECGPHGREIPAA